MPVTEDFIDAIAEIKALQNALRVELRKADGDIFAPAVQRISRTLAKKIDAYQNERLNRQR